MQHCVVHALLVLHVSSANSPAITGMLAYLQILFCCCQSILHFSLCNCQLLLSVRNPPRSKRELRQHVPALLAALCYVPHFAFQELHADFRCCTRCLLCLELLPQRLQLRRQISSCSATRGSCCGSARLLALQGSNVNAAAVW
jgi:hypothetical protein